MSDEDRGRGLTAAAPYICPTCKRKSFHPEDARNKYCSVCGFENGPFKGNPLLEAWRVQTGGCNLRADSQLLGKEGVDNWINARAARERLCRPWAWAIPDDKALEIIAQHRRIVEIGAGTGYWAALLAARGVDIVAYDAAPPGSGACACGCELSSNHWHMNAPLRYSVERGGSEMAAEHSSRALFLCWPPYSNSMAADCLRAYRGRFVIYVGEGVGGCTGDDTFHEMLDKDWSVVTEHTLPQWPGIHDYLAIYAKKAP